MICDLNMAWFMNSNGTISTDIALFADPKGNWSQTSIAFCSPGKFEEKECI